MVKTKQELYKEFDVARRELNAAQAHEREYLKQLHQHIQQSLENKAFEIAKLKGPYPFLDITYCDFYFMDSGIDVSMYDGNGDYVDECLVTWEELNAD